MIHIFVLHCKILVKIKHYYNYIPLADLSLRLTASLDAVKKETQHVIKDGKRQIKKLLSDFISHNHYIHLQYGNRYRKRQYKFDELFLSIDNQVLELLSQYLENPN